MDKLTDNKNVALSSAVMTITAGASALAKTTAVINCTIDGNIMSAIAAGNLPALTGINLVAGSTLAITVSATIAGAFILTASPAVVSTALDTSSIFPIGSHGAFTGVAAVVSGQALVGYIIIKNATAATFIGGTTALDTALLTVTYLNAVGGFTK